MVYYGAVSKGCERCRQRKVRCDSRRPGCLKCEKYGQQCPGYRDLANVLFRDERSRIIRKAAHTEEEETIYLASNKPSNGLDHFHRIVEGVNVAHLTNTLFRPFECDPHELGLNFFLKKYSLEGPSATQQLGWLKESHIEGPRKRILRMAIEAVGLAGLSNVHYVPRYAIESRKEYCRALLHLQRALGDPVQAVSDLTLMTIYLLVLYEMINFDHWRQYQSWATHVRAIASLLALRGKDQFDRDRGVHIYLQVRSQIQRETVPATLVQTSYVFHRSSARNRWRQQNLATSGSICEIAFRIVNLRAAVHNKEIRDPSTIYNKVVEIEKDLLAWKMGIHPHWHYRTVDEPASGSIYNHKRHVYSTVWVAEAWNGWRGMRILAHQIMMWNIASEVRSGKSVISNSMHIIREMSEDIVVSVTSFMDSPRLLSLIEPLYCVAQEAVNDTNVRVYAIRQLRYINASMGVRQAALLADSATEQLQGWPSSAVSH